MNEVRIIGSDAYENAFATALLVAGPYAAPDASTCSPRSAALAQSACRGPTLAPRLARRYRQGKADLRPGEVSRSAPINGVLTLCSAADAARLTRMARNRRLRPPQRAGAIPSPQGTPRICRDSRKCQLGELRHRERSTQASASSTIGSCSAVGPGSASGCFNQRVKESRLENKTRAAEVPVPP